VSAVLAFQFLGRVLRSSPGKTYCVILDPHRNVERHGSGTRPAAVAGSVNGASLIGLEEAAEMENLRTIAGNAPPPEPREIRLAFVSAVEEWTGAVLLSLRMAGMVTDERESREGATDDWRGIDPSARQLATLERLRWATKLLPEHAREPVRQLIDAREHLARGAVSDLLTVLVNLARVSSGVRKSAKNHVAAGGTWRTAPRWRWPSAVEVAPVPPAPSGKDLRRLEEYAHAAR